MNTPSFSGARYFITFIDDHSRHMFVYFLHSKDQALNAFKEFKALVENETGRTIKRVRTDGGGEYCSNALKSVFKSAGIEHQITPPHTPQQNGVAERANRTLVEKARAMLHGANLDYRFWAEAVSTASYLHERSLTSSIPNMTPYEAWYGHKPHVSHLRVFGCAAYAHIPKADRRKLDPKSF